MRPRKYTYPNDRFGFKKQMNYLYGGKEKGTLHGSHYGKRLQKSGRR